MSGIIQRLQSATACERALFLAVMAIASALLSWRLPEPDIVVFDKTPMLPALWFGLVLCAGVALWSSRSPVALVVVLVASGAAWLAAFEATVHVQSNIVDQIISQSGAPTPNFTVPVVNYLLGLCGMLGGLIGSAILVLVVSVSVGSARSVPTWTRTVLIGTVAGLFLECAASRTAGDVFFHIDSLLPLFLVWQIGVAASMAYDFAKPAAASGGPHP